MRPVSLPSWLFSALLLLVSATLHAEEAPAEAAAPAAPQAAPVVREFETMSDANKVAGDEDLICRNETPLGSRFPKRVCATKSEWRRAQAAARDEMGNKARKGPSLPASR